MTTPKGPPPAFLPGHRQVVDSAQGSISRLSWWVDVQVALLEAGIAQSYGERLVEYLSWRDWERVHRRGAARADKSVTSLDGDSDARPAAGGAHSTPWLAWDAATPRYTDGAWHRALVPRVIVRGWW